MVNDDKIYINKHDKEHTGFYMDGYLKDNLETYLIGGVKRKWDGVVLVTGIEGSGKTTIASTICSFCDPNFTLKKLVFTVPQFFDAVDMKIKTCQFFPVVNP